ncbi:MAG: tRNA (adenosine(37)-N6)-threonylcarbamoyltransferase complex ATPase subunit type 1 TsaE, partial [Verrucomicrobiota bacterium]
GVNSPTFALHQTYEAPSTVVDHFDLYRVESDAELETTGLWDVLLKPKGLILVEWADRLPANFRAPGWRLIALEFLWSGEDRSVTVRID